MRQGRIVAERSGRATARTNARSATRGYVSVHERRQGSRRFIGGGIVASTWPTPGSPLDGLRDGENQRRPSTSGRRARYSVTLVDDVASRYASSCKSAGRLPLGRSGASSSWTAPEWPADGSEPVGSAWTTRSRPDEACDHAAISPEALRRGHLAVLSLTRTRRPTRWPSCRALGGRIRGARDGSTLGESEVRRVVTDEGVTTRTRHRCRRRWSRASRQCSGRGCRPHPWNTAHRIRASRVRMPRDARFRDPDNLATQERERGMS